MRILITGGAGFIGSHLAEAYLKKGDEVYIIDDLSTGSEENLKHFKDDPVFRDRLFVHFDTILNESILSELTDTCDVVFHLAAAVGVRYILDHPLDLIQTNIRGTETVLKLCDKLKKKVLITSSSEVYGKHLHAPLVETDNLLYGPPDKSRWSYAASKLMQEFTALAYHQTRNLQVIIARLFNTIGPGQTGAYGMVVPRFVDQALKNQSLTVYGDGSQTRTFTDVKNVVAALMDLMNSEKTVGEIFNIGGKEEISIQDLALKIIKLSESSSKIQLIPYHRAYGKNFEDMLRRVPSTEKLRSYIDFQPTNVLDDILEKVIAGMRTKLHHLRN